MVRLGINHALFLMTVVCGLAGTSAQACKLSSKFNQPHSSALAAHAPALNDSETMPRHERTIVGLWNSEYVGADGSIDRGFDSFYADGNELLIDDSAPATDNVCSGVWEQTGPFTYEVNHPSWDFDASGNLMSIVVLRATVVVDERGNKFKGTESVVVYDPTLTTILYQSTGTVTGMRIRARSNPL